MLECFEQQTAAPRNASKSQSIYQAVPATGDQAVLQGEAAAAYGFLTLLKTLRENIAVLDKQIAQLVAAHPDHALFASLPGTGLGVEAGSMSRRIFRKLLKA